MPMAGATTPNTNAGTNAATGGSGATPVTAPVLSKTWELSDYELHRTPQEAITDGSEIAVSPRALHSELMCPICLDMLHETMTTKECLHRFCAECIITALRSGNKECPTCRKKLVSKRSLRRDPNFDMLISKIYPSREEYEAQQQKAIARLGKSHNQLALATSIEEGMKAQQSHNRKIAKATKNCGGAGNNNNNGDVLPPITDSPTGGVVVGNGGVGNSTPLDGLTLLNNVIIEPSDGASAAHGAPSNSNNGMGGGSGIIPPKSGASRTNSIGDNSSNTSDEVTEVELVFKPHPDMIPSSSGGGGQDFPQVSQLQTRFIKTSANASVEHLNKYLGMRLGLELDIDTDKDKKSHIACSTWIAPNGNFIRIPHGLTLGQICDKYWRFNKPLEVFYCVNYVKKDEIFE
ncbi:E3 ubiquitin-protein ligase RING2 [Folsomia candida]|uniref:RING-type E3 ubiquitin transferase n=1 Tax=Folsomia candida TaxID=158441 RepID=A0A226DYL1_FOLCA|nr:E3 ubiquitin-protein ligase RING2 [Folsomia candida]OXA50555.1 E3 ubiquitin-protein ligase RING2 [Folsomia candida]